MVAFIILGITIVTELEDNTLATSNTNGKTQFNFQQVFY